MEEWRPEQLCDLEEAVLIFTYQNITTELLKTMAVFTQRPASVQKLTARTLLLLFQNPIFSQLFIHLCHKKRSYIYHGTENFLIIH